jgi:polysaccharide deacetylase 2 family uncharacterized protein YibQ
MTHQTGAIRRWLLFFILIATAWFLTQRIGPGYNLKVVSGEVEKSVNRELAAFGFTDRQIISELHREHGWGPWLWIQSDRRIALQDNAVLSSFSSALSRDLGRSYSHLVYSTRPEGNLIEVKMGWFLLQRLLFVKAVAAPEIKAPSGPSVAFVIDDVAYDMNAMDHFVALGVPLTFAILPRDKHSRDLADKANNLHYTVILHLPMQPIDLAHNDPGGAGLYLRMSPSELHSQFEKDVASVPHIVGINNHMGSAFTEDESKMEMVLRWVKAKHLFFLDSRTSTHSIVPKAAKRVGVPCRVNETFLDNSDETEDIEQQLDIVLKLALRHKQTIAIGHYRRKHLVEALANKIPEFRAHGVTFVGLPAFYPSAQP